MLTLNCNFIGSSTPPQGFDFWVLISPGHSQITASLFLVPEWPLFLRYVCPNFMRLVGLNLLFWYHAHPSFRADWEEARELARSQRNPPLLWELGYHRTVWGETALPREMRNAPTDSLVRNSGPLPSAVPKELLGLATDFYSIVVKGQWSSGVWVSLQPEMGWGS